MNTVSGQDLVGKVRYEERESRHGHAGLVVWLTGLSGAGKSTIAAGLERLLFDEGKETCLLDGDVLRTGLCSDLGFSATDRSENIRRAGEVAALMADAGMIVIAAFISPMRMDRKRVRQMVPPNSFVEVFVNAPLAVCEQRDVKGLYARAKSNQIQDFTGISAPYEAPARPELELCTDRLTVVGAVATLREHLRQRFG